MSLPAVCGHTAAISTAATHTASVRPSEEAPPTKSKGNSADFTRKPGDDDDNDDGGTQRHSSVKVKTWRVLETPHIACLNWLCVQFDVSSGTHGTVA